MVWGVKVILIREGIGWVGCDWAVDVGCRSGCMFWESIWEEIEGVGCGGWENSLGGVES